MDYSHSNILLIGDSRVRRIGEFASTYRPDLFNYCEIIPFSGKTLNYIIGKMLDILKNVKYEVVIVLAGVNDLNNKGVNGISLNDNYINKMPAIMMSEIQFGVWSAESIAPNTRIIFCPELGLCASKYNDYLSGLDCSAKKYDNLDDLQKLLIQKLKKFNENVVSFNDRASLPTPLFHRRMFHKYKNRGIRCAFSLLQDGIHQSDEFSNIIIDSLIECILKIE